MKKHHVVIGAVVLVALSVLTLWQLPQSRVIAQQGLRTTAIERRSLDVTVDSSGSVAAKQSIYLTFQTTATLKSLQVQVGSEVKAGQELARLDTSDLEYAIALKEKALDVQQANYDKLVTPATAEDRAKAEASIASAESQLKSVQISLDKASNQEAINCSDVKTRQDKVDTATDNYNNYLEDGYAMDPTFMPDSDAAEATALRDAQLSLTVAQAQCDNTTSLDEYQTKVDAAKASLDQANATLKSLDDGPTATEIASSKAQLEQAKLELENAKKSLDDAVIVAPFDGIVSEVNISIGQLVSTNTNAIKLLDNQSLHVDVNVDELDIAQVQVGQKVTVEPDALSNTQIQGTVSWISPEGTTSSGVVSFAVRVDVDAKDQSKVRSGMTTNVKIIVSHVENVLVVLTEAIQRDGQQEFIDVLSGANNNSVPNRVFITTGDTIDNVTVIQGEVSEGMQVVVPTSTATNGTSLLGGGN